jgi:nicotinamide phosphoribosyltransferase
MNINPVLAIDGYKVSHKNQFPEGCNLVYSNLTARSAKHKTIPDSIWTGKTVFFGLQYFIKKFLIEDFNKNFFSRSREDVVNEYTLCMDSYLGPKTVDVKHIGELHDLGYLPIEIHALQEGTLVDIGIPYLVIFNTDPKFYWLTNYLETILSSYMWPMITSATTAYHYKKFLIESAKRTGGNIDFVNWQGHDFSARGMFGLEAMMMSGAAHLTSFTGSDTVSAINLLEKYYNAKGLIAGSVAAQEHAVSCAMTGVYRNNEYPNNPYPFGSTEYGEYQGLRRTITEVYPKGIVSVIADTYDFFRFINEFVRQLKSEIMAREGKVVCRPDSGNPEFIICGDPSAPVDSLEYKGAIRILWEIFGGTVNEQGYKTLDSHIGLIYGDSITPSRCEKIINRLAEMGFASDNIVLGIGSFSYQLVSRDTFGMAIKATYCEVNGEPIMIFKDPKTNDGNMNKKSLQGCVIVDVDSEGKLKVKDGYTLKQSVGKGLLCPVFRNGLLLEETSLRDIRDMLTPEKVNSMMPGGGIVSPAVSNLPNMDMDESQGCA